MGKRIRLLAVLLVIAAILAGCSSNDQSKQAADNKAATDTADTVNAAFEPKLDTQKAVSIEAAVCFGNFEALDQVINDFNEIYPKVEISYTQLFVESKDFLENNASIDIFMPSTEKEYPQDSCLDLKEAGIDLSTIDDNLLKNYSLDGKVLALPMSLNLNGIVVNKTLLDKEGLSVPETWSEFLSVLEALKQKGYTPLQGATDYIGTLACNICMSMMNSDAELLKAVESGDVNGAAKLKIAFERVNELVEKGYISNEVNAEYPSDNYDGAIMKFFEGDVPFWVCTTEKFSGMKKRESKSETFSANPFEYEFISAPMGDNGAYRFIKPWNGFAVNKNSDVADYAVEFLRFMARTEELNKLASIKGVPSAAKETSDERYANLYTAKAEMSVTSNGDVPAYFGVHATGSANKLLTGELTTVDEALATFVAKCSGSEN